MSKGISVLLLAFLAFASCSTNRKAVYNQAGHHTFDVSLDTVSLFDNLRNREVPVAIFKPKRYSSNYPRQLVIFSHGYGENKPGSYLAYSYLTNFLASKGYFVVSIQHELPTDRLIPTAGIPRIVRRPFWERGADNILFVINELKKLNPQLNFEHVTLIGHSNGADMTALFPQKYPGRVDRIVTLDNRRMPLPRLTGVAVYSLRSSDQPADDGVLLTSEEQRKFEITIIKLANTRHNDMDDRGNENQHKEINDYILKFLAKK